MSIKSGKSGRSHTKSWKFRTKSRKPHLDDEEFDDLFNLVPLQSFQKSPAHKRTVSITRSTSPPRDDLLEEKKQSNEIKYDNNSLDSGADTPKMTRLSDITQITETSLTLLKQRQTLSDISHIPETQTDITDDGDITDYSDISDASSVIHSAEICRNRRRRDQLNTVLDTIDENNINPAFSHYSLTSKRSFRTSSSHSLARRSSSSRSRLNIKKTRKARIYLYCKDMFRLFLKAVLISSLVGFVVLTTELLVFYFFHWP